MLNHLVHGVFLQELPILVAVLAVVEVCAAVSIRAAILDTGQRHTATLTKLRQLSWLECFSLLREGGFVSLECFRILVCHEIALGRAISSLTIAPIARYQFLSEEVRNLGIARLCMIVNIYLAGKVEACVTVELDISFHLQKTYAHLLGLFYRILQQFQTIALTLVVGMNADGTESPRREHRSIVKRNLCFGKHHMADNYSIFLHHKVEFRDEIGVCSILIEHVMLCASRTIDIPECLSRKVFHLTIIFRSF